jgi:hypothetical protein
MRRVISLPFLIVCASLLVGCDDGDLGMTIGNDDSARIAAEIRRIEDHPNMPDQAKAIALGQLRQRQAAAQATAEAADLADKARRAEQQNERTKR